jgi:RNA polymerase sigma factor (sigma-70 family)
VAVTPTNVFADDPRSRVAAVVVRHERALLRVARQASLCHDDALDAYQRALEIFVRRVETVDPATEVAWLKVVIRHEAMAIRRARSESVTGEDIDLDEFMPGSERSVEDVIASGERVRRSAEALRALKPDEATALMMKAHGLSYEEIGKRNGWTYTKVNRVLTEGRRRFMDAYEGIESGAECERFAGIVEALAAGGATAAQLVQIRPHLRHCIACRAAVRDLHLSRRQSASLFWPAFLLASTPSSSADMVGEGPLQSFELGATPPEPERLATAKHHVLDFFHRTQASDVATGIQIAASGSGGRLATVGAVLGLCLSSVGVGTVCVVSGLVTDPLGLIHQEHPRAPRHHARATPTPTPTSEPARIVAAPTISAPRLVATPPRRVVKKRTSRPREPAQGTKPASHENAPISPAVASTAGYDSFTPEVPQATRDPASAPATGGDEFTP